MIFQTSSLQDGATMNKRLSLIGLGFRGRKLLTYVQPIQLGADRVFGMQFIRRSSRQIALTVVHASFLYSEAPAQHPESNHLAQIHSPHGHS